MMEKDRDLTQKDNEPMCPAPYFPHDKWENMLIADEIG